MKKSKFYLLSGFLGLAITTLLVSNLAHAYQGRPDLVGIQLDPAKQQLMEEKRQVIEAERQAIEDSITNQDYNTWQEIIDSRPRITDYINQDNFAQFAEMHQLMKDGKFEEAQAIRDELGLPDRMGMGFGGGFRMGPHAGYHPDWSAETSK